MKSWWKVVLAAVVAIVVVGGYVYIRPIWNKLSPTLPPAQPVKEARWLNQNWRSADRYWYHHASQGTSTLPIPYKWFISLAEPRLSLWGQPPLLARDAYLTGFGFIPSPPSGGGLSANGKGGQWTDPRYGYAQPVDGGEYANYGKALDDANPDGLPVGFAITRNVTNPTTGTPLPDQLGFTCAACHTGHLEYKGVSLRIDGANAGLNLGTFTDALGGALLLTDLLPWRFNDFAGRVLGPNASDADKKVLHEQLSAVLKTLKDAAGAVASVSKNDIQEGFNRLDALNRIGNTVFYQNLANAPGFNAVSNYAALNAPVKFPHIWDVPWVDWAQYDGSILQPVIRNAGEAMGVNALMNLTTANDPGRLWSSNVAVDTISAMEHLLAGPYPLTPAGDNKVTGFNGLMSPKWPEDVLGPIDAAKRDKGRALYAQYCQGCHLPPMDAPDQAIYAPTLWTTPNEHGESYLKAVLIDQSEVGTDPAEEQVLLQRQVTVPAYLGVQAGNPGWQPGTLCFTDPSEPQTKLGFGPALAYSVQMVVKKYLDDQGVTQDKNTRDALKGNRPNCIQARPVYKARPLNGIWAVPPYLHNGSVPSLYALLGSDPAKDRPKSFCLGNRAYDPGKVGLDVNDCPGGTFTLDTTLAGNSNRGHEFRNGTVGQNGVIGPALSEDDKLALIEFLKSQ
ncbi:di-heme-cytochrome C peroxidase [Nitrospirillum iridis]|uniref:Mono/diheme cytochrome c family protein n=1 Tax=Nitrospirillum iridis TaxID=765888 RepID=A0A7X0AU01_9PROT|nr:di-heme-cytochrome C peroxidase [Nitrospirillum iridis]MBB6250040.1 mono/diheme cytochrome c family protein [Nitrospirillum iridis]